MSFVLAHGELHDRVLINADYREILRFSMPAGGREIRSMLWFGHGRVLWGNNRATFVL